MARSGKSELGTGARGRRPRGGVVTAVLALLVGAAFIAYPFVSDAVNQARERRVVEAVGSAVSAIDESTLAAERQRAYEYNEDLLDGRAVVTDPFDPDADRPNDEDYNVSLNLSGDGVMGTINIPKIHLELPIYHGTEESTLEHGVGHLQGTSLPIGGDSSHCVLSGHTGLPTMKIFDNLDQLEAGDYFVISVLGEDHAYEVTSIEVVLPDETDSLVIERGRDLCTLVTCTPYGINSHRLLVHAERCELPAEWLDKGDADFPSGYTAPPDKALLPSVLLGLALAAGIIGLWLLVSWLRRRKREEEAPSGKHFEGNVVVTRGRRAGGSSRQEKPSDTADIGFISALDGRKPDGRTSREGRERRG